MIKSAEMDSRGRPEALARAMRSPEIASGHAVVVGNRAGVVEWADTAWRDLTGFPLEETVGKPITHFLTAADFEPETRAELVEFIAGNFVTGRSCAVELPFVNLAGRSLDVHLEVEPITDDRGEISNFVAVVKEVSHEEDESGGTEEASQAEPSSARPSLPLPLPSHERTSLTSLSRAVINRVARSVAERTRSNWTLDVAFDPSTPEIAAPGDEVAQLLEALLEATGLLRETTSDVARVVSVSTGAVAPGRSQHSPVHPIPAHCVARREVPGVWIEVHDTDSHLPRDVVARIEQGVSGSTPRENDWANAFAIARALSAMIHFDSTPGCGNRALVVFDLADCSDHTDLAAD